MFKKNRELSMHVKDVIERKDQAGIRPSKTFQALVDEAGGRSNMKFLEKDVRNYISGKLRINGDDTDAKEMLDYFTRMKEQNPNFFYDICVYSDNSLKHAFSTDARSRAAYKYFGDVVSLTPHISSTSNFFFLVYFFNVSLIFKLTNCPTC
ncbi:Protein FAR1-RELATED SEQUENCE [Arachis hypogaea]|nr:Protein FAR1-RELATED SEQUENCE [Arachis hypogaea]